MLQLLSKRQIMKDIIYCGMYKIGLVCHFPHNNHFVINRNAVIRRMMKTSSIRSKSGDKQQTDNSEKNETYHKQTEWVKAVLALAHKLLMLMHRLATCLLLYLCLCLRL